MSTMEQVRGARRLTDAAGEELRAYIERTETLPPDRARHTKLVNAVHETGREYLRVASQLKLPSLH
jgi:hypothetical protein